MAAGAALQATRLTSDALAEAKSNNSAQGEFATRAQQASERQANEALRTTIADAALQARPYLYLVSTKQRPMPPGERLSFNITLGNYGVSPATHVRLRGLVFHGTDALKQADDYFKLLAKNGFRTNSGGFVVPPGNSDKDASFSTLSSKDVSSTDEINAILQFDFGVVIAGEVVYSDVSNKTYRTTFCLGSFANGAMPHCQTHNEIY